MNAHRTPLSRLRAALAGRRAEGSSAFAGTGAPSVDGRGALSGDPVAALVVGPRGLLTVRRVRRSRMAFAALCAAILSLAAAYSLALPPVPVTPAHAGTVSGERPFLFAFDGHDATAGAFTRSGLTGLAVDNSTGAVYVANGTETGEVDFLSKFNAEGQAQSFSATGTSSLFGSLGFPFGTLLSPAVDNSGRPGYQGDLFVSHYYKAAWHAFAPTGTPLWALPLAYNAEDVAVDSSGHPWLQGRQYENTGTPPAPTGCTGGAAGGKVDVDASGNLYAASFGTVRKYTKTGACTFTQSTFDSNGSDVYANQSTTLPSPSTAGHIFTAQAGNFEEYDSSGAHLGTYGGNYLSIGGATIAYNPARDWVYVGQRYEPRPVVAVFGPPTSGTAPEVTATAAAPTGAEVSTAHLSGEVNPESVASTAHFEWKRSSESWASAAARQSSPPIQSSPPLSLTTNSTPQAVAFDTDSLRGNTTYQVRLVGVNSADKLAGFSAAPVTITTKKATEAPIATTSPVTTFTTTTATVAGTVNPKGDTADWRVQLARGGCAGSPSFGNQTLLALAHSSTTAQNVSYQVNGLLPSERYCVRIWAENSYGSATSAASENREFTTAPIAPDEAETIAAAPRTDSSARLNARVNPEGEALTYRFEWSEDGSTWHAMPDETYSGEDREQIVVGEQLENLSPNTTYHYRFSAENPADAGSPVQGGEKTFTTRTTAEIEAAGPPSGSCPNEAVRALQRSTYLGECRGLELVNSPEKGNQEVVAVGEDATGPHGAISLDGERALWAVTGGSPGGNASSGDIYLARRTASGWVSKTLIAPPAEQFGEAGLGFGLQASTPALSAFAFETRSHDIGSTVPPTTLRLDDAQHQEVLGQVEHGLRAGVNLTEDGGHVLGYNGYAPFHLWEIGPNGQSEALDVMPDGTPSSCGVGNAYERWQQFEIGYSSIAATDASRVYFEAAPNGACSAPHGLYERNRKAATTTLIDPGASGRGQEGWPELIRTSPDGRQAYYLTVDKCRKWTQTYPFSCEAPEAADANTDADVYRWDEETGESTCLTCVVPDAKPELAAVHPFAGVLVSNDFSHIYFESQKQLIPGQGRELTGRYRGEAANIYTLSGGALRFVASTSGDFGLGIGVARISSDGNVLVFRAKPSRRLSSDAVASGVTQELYRYDDRDQSLECLSCRHGGETTQAVSEVVGSAMAQSWGVSADGRTVVFRTAEALLPADVNNAPDLYEWRDGVLHLITDGITEFPEEGPNAPVLAAIDPSGANVLFTVLKPGLTGFEADGYDNLYDARVGGGFVPPSPPAHCSEESCQGPLQPAPALPVGGGNFQGAGNLHPKLSCRKGSVRRHGRCVKRRKRRHHVRRHGRAAHANQGRSK